MIEAAIKTVNLTFPEIWDEIGPTGVEILVETILRDGLRALSENSKAP
jgi:hypothetical protein